jgi:hypothetical protein
MQKANLQPGNYMKVESVLSYFNHYNVKSTLASIIKKVCPVHEGEFSILYDTKDLKSVIVPDLFRELECHVNTLMIIE